MHAFSTFTDRMLHAVICLLMFVAGSWAVEKASMWIIPTRSASLVTPVVVADAAPVVNADIPLDDAWLADRVIKEMMRDGTIKYLTAEQRDTLHNSVVPRLKVLVNEQLAARDWPNDVLTNPRELYACVIADNSGEIFSWFSETANFGPDQVNW